MRLAAGLLWQESIDDALSFEDTSCSDNIRGLLVFNREIYAMYFLEYFAFLICHTSSWKLFLSHVMLEDRAYVI